MVCYFRSSSSCDNDIAISCQCDLESPGLIEPSNANNVENCLAVEVLRHFHMRAKNDTGGPNDQGNSSQSIGMV